MMKVIFFLVVECVLKLTWRRKYQSFAAGEVLKWTSSANKCEAIGFNAVVEQLRVGNWIHEDERN